MEVWLVLHLCTVGSLQVRHTHTSVLVPGRACSCAGSASGRCRPALHQPAAAAQFACQEPVQHSPAYTCAATVLCCARLLLWSQVLAPSLLPQAHLADRSVLRGTALQGWTASSRLPRHAPALPADSAPHLSQEAFDRGHLHRQRAAPGSLPELSCVLATALDIANGMACIHAHDVIHRRGLPAVGSPCAGCAMPSCAAAQPTHSGWERSVLSVHVCFTWSHVCSLPNPGADRADTNVCLQRPDAKERAAGPRAEGPPRLCGQGAWPPSCLCCPLVEPVLLAAESSASAAYVALPMAGFSAPQVVSGAACER